MSNYYLITTKFGLEVKVYKHHTGAYINADDCKTTYSKAIVTSVKELKEDEKN